MRRGELWKSFGGGGECRLLLGQAGLGDFAVDAFLEFGFGVVVGEDFGVAAGDAFTGVHDVGHHVPELIEDFDVFVDEGLFLADFFVLLLVLELDVVANCFQFVVSLIGEAFCLQCREVVVDVLEQDFKAFDDAFDVFVVYFFAKLKYAEVFGEDGEVFGSFNVSFEQLKQGAQAFGVGVEYVGYFFELCEQFLGIDDVRIVGKRKYDDGVIKTGTMISQ